MIYFKLLVSTDTKFNRTTYNGGFMGLFIFLKNSRKRIVCVLCKLT